MPEKYTLYVLELEPKDGTTGNGRWYVGITSDYETRLEQHEAGHGAKCLEDKVVVEDYPLGYIEGRREAEKCENNLTKAIAKEYGWDTVRGGTFVKRNRENFPDVSDTGLIPYIGDAVEEKGPDDLKEVVKHSRVTLEVAEPLEFDRKEYALEWADRYLPDGTEFKVK